MVLAPKTARKEALRSEEQRDVAIALSDIYRQQIKDKAVSDALIKIRNIVWKEPEKIKGGDNGFANDTQRRKMDGELVKGIIERLETDEQRKELAEAYIRLGHLYEIAGHAARENFFHNRELQLQEFTEKNPPGTTPPLDMVTPGGVHELLFHDDVFSKINDVNDVVRMLSEPVSEYVFTQHPTNTNQLVSMQLQRKIADLLDKVTHKEGVVGSEDEDRVKLAQAIAEYGQTQITSKDNFTVFDEASININYLSNAYHDLDRLYEVTERGLGRKFADYKDDQRWDLDLKQHFSSWGSAGDKDGNNNIKSENTLEAIAMHKFAATKLLADDLANIPQLATWRDKLVAAAQSYETVVKSLEAIRKANAKPGNANDIPLTNEQFDSFRADITKADKALGPQQQFLDDVKATSQKEGGEVGEKLLQLHRKARIFGFNLGKIEYRETAGEYENAINAMMHSKPFREKLPEVSRFFDQKPPKNEGQASYKDELNDYNGRRAEVLSSMLSDEHTRSRWIEATKEFMQHAEGEKLRKYGKDEKGSEVMAYHTLRRMELARDFDAMITHNVLAECKGTHNLLEALALQVATTQEVDGKVKRAMLHVVPLFEEAETMKKIPEILNESLDNNKSSGDEAYKAHLRELQKKEGTTGLTQQIQIAHSDNARRAGSIASRGIIHEGHRQARIAIDTYNASHPDEQVNLQFFEGGSQSDSYRNGVRAATAAIRDFGLGEFYKATFQGGDLLNYFNQPTSCERLMLRSIVEQAKLNYETRNKPKSQEDKNRDKMEALVNASLTKLQDKYDTNMFSDAGNPLGKMLYALDYKLKALAGNAGSRAAARVEIDPNDTAAVELQRREDDYERRNGIDPKVIRTIPFSQVMQHAGLNPAFIGSGELANTLKNKFRQSPDERELLVKAAQKPEYGDEFKGVALFESDGTPNAQCWKLLYKESTAFRDAIDKLSYSVLTSDMTRFKNKMQMKPQDEELSKYAGVTIPDEYIQAARIVFEARTGEKFVQQKPENDELYAKQLSEVISARTDLDANQKEKLLKEKIAVRNEMLAVEYDKKSHEGDHNLFTACDHARNIVRQYTNLDHFHPLDYKRQYARGLDIIVDKIKGTDDAFTLARLENNGNQLNSHGRSFTFDDPKYRNAYVQASASRGESQGVAA